MQVRIIKCSNSRAWWKKNIGHNVNIIQNSKFIDSEGYLSYYLDNTQRFIMGGDYIYEEDISFLKQNRKLKLEKIYESR